MPRRHSVPFSEVRHVFERCRTSGKFFPPPPTDGRTLEAAKFARYLATHTSLIQEIGGIILSSDELSSLRGFCRMALGGTTFYSACIQGKHFYCSVQCTNCSSCPICFAQGRSYNNCVLCLPDLLVHCVDGYCERCSGKTIKCNICNECCRHCNCLQCQECCKFHSNGTVFCRICFKCNECCYCIVCRVCQNRMRPDQLCSVCNVCRRSTCCQCIRCGYCDIVLPSVHCEDCVQCSRHCRCEENRHCISRITQKSNIYEYQNEPLVGVEVEFNHCDDFYPIRKWSKKWGAGIHSDGSCGWEAVTTPAAGPFLMGQIRDLCEAFDESSAQADRRCGIHVHVDARKLTAIHVLRLAKLYCHIEPVLYAIAGDYRVGNDYSAPNGRYLRKAISDSGKSGRSREIYGLLGGIFSPRYSDDIKSILRRKPEKKIEARYYGLNLCPWVAGRIRKSKDTTIEFRMHRNSLNRKRIIGWSLLCASLVKWCKNYDTDLLCKINPVRACAVVAPDLSGWIMSRIIEWKNNTTIKNRNVVFSKGHWKFKWKEYNGG